MNKTAIKNFAIWARVQLIESAKQRAYEYEITENGENNPNLETISGRLLSKVEKEQRQQLIAQIRQKGYNQVMEEAAYTWFNRFIALRFMEVNGYLPSKVRVFTDENNAFKPEVLKEAMTVEIDGLDRSVVLDLLDKQNNEELYKYLLITQCNALNQGLPYMFEKISNWTELLFPANLLRADSVIGRMVSDIAEDDFQEEVEIIGWLYQYYISEKHEEVIDPLHGKIIKKEDIPAATQLFTTDWVVRYILDNSLGRYWIERNPGSSLASKLTYLVTPKNGEIETINERITPEELKVLDPCVGSGHFLSYAFDILLEIYRECGWSDRDAAKSILENNLYGLDIDDRATQLACFAVAMKARKYNRRILNGETDLNIVAMQDSVFITDDFIHYFANKDENLRKDIQELRVVFNNAKEYGSIISAPKLNYAALYERIDIIRRSFAEDIFQIEYQNIAAEQLLPLVKQAEILSKKYDIVATNPPYMNKYSARLKDYINQHFADYKGDLFSVFMFRNFAFCKENGYSGFMTPNVWMFIKSYEELRAYIIGHKSIATLVQMAKGAFFKEATVDVCAFVIKNEYSNQNGLYIRLEDFKGDMDVQKQAVLAAIQNPTVTYFYERLASSFSKIPGSPVAYFFTQRIFDIFDNNKPLSAVGTTRLGMTTADNERFTRFWYEPVFDKCILSARNADEVVQSGRKWVPYNKGGKFRKWYGNLDVCVNWSNDGIEIKNFADENGRIRSTVPNTEYYFLPCITWSKISSGNIAFRFRPQGSIFDVAGACLYSDKKIYLLGLLNSKICMHILSVLSPTLNFEGGHISSIPIAIRNEVEVISIVEQNISFSRADWDAFETSWDFKRHPLISGEHTVAEAFDKWEREAAERFDALKANEEELNRIFIDIYGLQDELTPEVEDKDVTVRPADLKRDIRSLISYAVGCMFGRYSLDIEGLAYAGGDWDNSKYRTFIPDKDNILPICDDDYFDDDILGRFVDFVRVVYGAETLEENLKFIADAIGGNGTPREVIRNYFLNDFFKDHCKIYQKRPIYWLFDSGKKNGFKALIYMHRYQPDLLARMRTDYVHEQQERYRTQLQMLEDSAQTAAPAERVKLNKQITKLKDQSLEIQKYEEQIHHLADQMIPIDLDDGVKVNYAKFADVLAVIK